VLFDNENALELFLSSLKTNSQPETIPQAINPEPRPTKTESAESEPPIMPPEPKNRSFWNKLFK
jgi:hypothetical protein